MTLKVLPAEETSIALFILSRIQMGETYTSIRVIFYGLKFVHNSNGSSDPTTNYMVRSMFEAAHRLCKIDTNKKEPIQIEQIEKLYENLVLHSTSLTDVRTMVICLLGYSVFLRYSEIANIRRHDYHL